MSRFRQRISALLAIVLLGSCAPQQPPEAGPWRFAVVGDTQGPGLLAPINTNSLRPLAESIADEQVDLVLVPGDLVYGTPLGLPLHLYAWRAAMAPVYRSGARVCPTRGNHEAIGGPAAWRTVFDDLPQNGPASERGLTYSLAHQDVLFIACDQYARPHRVNQEWLDAVLADPDRPPHVVVFGHEPGFPTPNTDGLHKHSDHRDAFWTSLAAAGATYITGHDHLYARATIPDAAGRPVRQIIVGTGGGPLSYFSGYRDTRVQPSAAHAGHYGYLLVEVDGPRLRASYKAQLDPAHPELFTTVDEFDW